jgi:hypothetical protein
MIREKSNNLVSGNHTFTVQKSQTKDDRIKNTFGQDQDEAK